MNQVIHFSLKEIKKSGLDIKLLKFNNVKVDVRRKSEKPANIELLKKMKLTPLPIGGQKMPKKAKSTKTAKIKTEVKEIKEIPDNFERIELQERLIALGMFVKVDLEALRRRAEELHYLNFGIADAAHVAFAEQCRAEFVSCDDLLIKKCSKHNIKVWNGTPVAFCEKEGLR